MMPAMIKLKKYYCVQETACQWDKRRSMIIMLKVRIIYNSIDKQWLSMISTQKYDYGN